MSDVGGQPPEQTRSGSRVVLLVALAAVAVVGLGAAILFVARDGDDDSADAGGTAQGDPAGDPADVVAAYFAAAEDRDCETLIDLVSATTWGADGAATREDALANCNDAASTGQQLEGMSLDEIGEVSEEGDTATVEAIGTYEGEPITQTFTLLRESDRWKIDLTP